MALFKPKTLPTGVTGDYWTIADLNVNKLTKFAHVTICLFVNELVRRTPGAQPIDSMSFSWQGEDFPFVVEGNNYAAAYTKMKQPVPAPMEGGLTASFFADALDV